VPAAEAIALRDTVRMAALQGQTSSQIVEGVVARYGERMRTLPRRDGFGLWAWLAPPLVLLAGAFAVFFAIRRMRGPHVRHARAGRRDDRRGPRAAGRGAAGLRARRGGRMTVLVLG
jgi:cytochrome c-type biogenesis protein CcmH/NrfF